MKLGSWLAARGRGAQRQLERDSGVSVTTIQQVAGGRAVRDLDVARRLSAATNGDVSVAELLGLRRSDVEGLFRRAS